MSSENQLEAVQHRLEGLYGRRPDGLVLIGADRTVRVIDALACRVFQIDPVESLGQPIPDVLESLLELEAEESLVEVDQAGEMFFIRHAESDFGDLIGLWVGDPGEMQIPSPVSDDSIDYVEALLAHATLDELLDWLSEAFESWADGQRGAVALRDGEFMNLRAIWPLDQPVLLPVRFACRESQAFRTARVGRASQVVEPLLGTDSAHVEPLVGEGQVIGLVAWEGDQPMVNRLIPFLPLAILRLMS